MFSRVFFIAAAVPTTLRAIYYERDTPGTTNTTITRTPNSSSNNNNVFLLALSFLFDLFFLVL